MERLLYQVRVIAYNWCWVSFHSTRAYFLSLIEQT